VFWIWCYGFFATTIKFTEAVLGVQYRRIDAAGRLSAGAMHYLRDGLRMPRLGFAYALIAGVAALTTTPFTQPNSIAEVFRSQLSVPTWATGLALALLDLAGDHRRHPRDRPRDGEARAAQGLPVPGRRTVRDRHARAPAAGGCWR
jgi:hypothetical protein